MNIININTIKYILLLNLIWMKNPKNVIKKNADSPSNMPDIENCDCTYYPVYYDRYY